MIIVVTSRRPWKASDVWKFESLVRFWGEFQIWDKLLSRSSCFRLPWVMVTLSYMKCWILLQPYQNSAILPEFWLFTALHEMKTRSIDGNSVCPSVLPSVCQTRALWQNGRKLCLDFYIIRKNIYPSFLRRRMVGGGDPFYLKFCVNRAAMERNRRFLNVSSLVAPQPYDLAKKSSINTNRKSSTRFPMSLRSVSYTHLTLPTILRV